MSAYYNENEPRAADWLRELINAGLIADGVVDERSITDVQPTDLMGYTQCHFFAGIGGWSHALRLAAWPDSRPVWTGSCPCQPFSSAGKGGGTSDDRHLWPDFYRLISKCRPTTVFGEQVASPLGMQWLNGVFADLESSAYAVAGANLCAAGVGAPHIRQRLYWVADTISYRPDPEECGTFTRTAEQRKGPPQQWRALSDSRAINGGMGHADESGREQGQQSSAPSRHGSAVVSNGCSGGLADANGPQFGRESAKHRESLYPQDAGLSRMADASHNGFTWPATAAEPTGRQLPESDSRMGNAEFARLEGYGGHERDRNEPRWLDSQAARPVAARRGNCPSLDFWHEWRFVHCSDGKARRIKSDVEPLVNGFPARVACLKGIGNAIVPQVAAEFIQAFQEVTP